MNVIVVEFANLVIEIHSEFTFMAKFCEQFITDKKDIDLVVKADEGYYERMNIEGCFSREYCESLSIFENIARKLPYYNKMVFHGACITYKEHGLLFTAPSGTGKTTHICLWKQYFKDDVDIVNGDKPILEVREDGVIAHSVPYSGKEGYYKNTSAKLKGICIIKQGTSNKTRRVSPSEAMVTLYTQMYIPYDSEEATLLTMGLLDALLKGCPIYELTCDISEDAVKSSYQAMIEGIYE